MTGDEGLERIEQKSDVVFQRVMIKVRRPTVEFGRLIGKAEFTVEEAMPSGSARGPEAAVGGGIRPGS